MTPELAELVQEAVASGEYASSSEVVREALRTWRLRRTPQLHEQVARRRLWAQGLASGPGRFEDAIDDIKAEARRRLSAATV